MGKVKTKKHDNTNKPIQLEVAHIHYLDKHQKTKQLDTAQVHHGAKEGETTERERRKSLPQPTRSKQNRARSAQVSHQSVPSTRRLSSWRQTKRSLDKIQAGYFQPCSDPWAKLRLHPIARGQIPMLLS